MFRVILCIQFYRLMQLIFSTSLSYEEMCINYRVDTYYRDVSIDDVCVRKTFGG